MKKFRGVVLDVFENEPLEEGQEGYPRYPAFRQDIVDFIDPVVGNIVETKINEDTLNYTFDVIEKFVDDSEDILKDSEIVVHGYFASSKMTGKGYVKGIKVEGKVVSNGALVSQNAATYTQNNTYDTTLINSVTVNVGGGSILIDKTITSNGTYTAANDTADGYKKVIANVHSGWRGTFQKIAQKVVRKMKEEHRTYLFGLLEKQFGKMSIRERLIAGSIIDEAVDLATKELQKENTNLAEVDENSKNNISSLSYERI